MSDYIKNYFQKLNINISKEQANRLYKYYKLLIEWNGYINLTGITEYKEVVIKHFADSIVPVIYMDFSRKNIIDVGSGAGFPGFPIKIVKEDVNLTLLDSLGKRIDFLTEVGRITDVEAKYIHGRAEDKGQDENFREKYDIAVSRAVAPLNILAEYDMPFVEKGGYFIALKGPGAYDEIKDAEKAINILGGKIAEVKDSILPDTDLKHCIVFIEKIKETPEKYPRRAKKIERSPL